MIRQSTQDSGSTAGLPVDAPPKPPTVVPLGTPAPYTPNFTPPTQTASFGVAPTPASTQAPTPAPVSTPAAPPPPTPAATPVAPPPVASTPTPLPALPPVAPVAPVVPTPDPTPAQPTPSASQVPALPATVPLQDAVGPTGGAGNGNTFVDSVANPSPASTTPTPAVTDSVPSLPLVIPPPVTQAPSPVLGTTPPTTLAPGVSTTPVNPADDLRGQLITPGPATNRFDIAKQELATYNQATDPYYQASLREADANAAGAGQLGSGQLRTSLGNLADARANELETQGQNFLTNALNNSIQDAYNNIGIAQQQQAYQTAAQNQSFNQGVVGATTQQGLTTSAIDNALAELAAGSSGSPADMQMLLSQIFSGNAASAGNALSGLTSGSVNNSAQTAATDALINYLRGLNIPTTSGTTS